MYNLGSRPPKSVDLLHLNGPSSILGKRKHKDVTDGPANGLADELRTSYRGDHLDLKARLLIEGRGFANRNRCRRRLSPVEG